MFKATKIFPKYNNVAQFTIFIIIGGIASILKGQDANWDLLNYHIYNAWNVLNHRGGQDVFAASIQSSFSPYLDMVYYKVGFEWLRNYPYTVAFLAGIPYGLLLLFSWKTIDLFSKNFEFRTQIERYFLNGIALTLASTGVFLWSLIGTTTNDITTSALVICGLYLYISNAHDEEKSNNHRGRILFLSGILLGIAASLKLTVAIYAPGLGVVILIHEKGMKSKFMSGLLYSLGWLAAFIIIYGPWAWHLYASTGNPFYPMFNSIFHSPMVTPHSALYGRYLPHGIWQWIFYPFYWMNNSRPLASPLAFFDLRYVTIYILAMLYAAHFGCNKLFSKINKKNCSMGRSLNSALLFLLVSYICWLIIFSLLRYSIVIEVIASSLIVFIAYYMMRVVLRCKNILLIYTPVILIVYTLIITASAPDWGHVRIGSKTFDADVPKLPPDPLVILSNSPMGILAPLINEKNPTASYVGLQNCFANNGWCAKMLLNYGTGHLIKNTIHGHTGPIYIAYYTNRNPSLPQLSLVNLRQDLESCVIMSTNITPNVLLCRAIRIKSVNAISNQIKYKLLADVHTLDKRDSITATWIENPCSTDVDRAKMRLDWKAPSARKLVQVYISKKDGDRQLFAAGSPVSQAETGEWVHAGKTFIFTADKFKTIAEVHIRYTQCN